MAQLTETQRKFLLSQNISLSMVFDATGLSTAERENRMAGLEMKFFYGGAICKKGGHSLRTKSNHCIECDTSKIAFQLRNCASGYVYLAYSKKKNYVKIGYSSAHPQDRGSFVRKEAYGGVLDWDIKKIEHFDRDAGKNEFLIHARLAQYQKLIIYEKNQINLLSAEKFSPVL